MEELIPQRGNYKKLISYQKTDVIYCLTYYFVEHYIRYNDRTKDQMLQAARSGKQNIIEGCAASVTSARTELQTILLFLHLQFQHHRNVPETKPRQRLSHLRDAPHL